MAVPQTKILFGLFIIFSVLYNIITPAHAGIPFLQYDYVVIGAGQAGCIAARKLSDAGYSVFVIERGDRIPANNTNSQLLGLATFNWEPPFTADNLMQKDSNGNRPNTLVGAVEGGGGMVNSAIAHFGARNWWNTLPWDFESQVVPAYNRLISHLSVLPVAEVPSVALNWIASGGQFLSFVNNNLNNPNGNPTFGFGNISVVSKPGANGLPVRDSTLFSYLDGANPYLVDVALEATATKISFSSSIPAKAKNVQFIQNGECKKVKAMKGVVVSAGAFGSADILLRSGIGPAAQLAPLGIDVVSNLPVGQGWQDHHSVGLLYLNNCPFSLQEDQLFVYTPGTQVAGFIQSNVSAHSWPDIQYTFVPLPPQNGLNFFELVIFLVDPQSRGTVTLANADPLKPSLKTYSYPGTTRDVEAITYAITAAESFMSKGPFASCLGPRITPAAGTNLASWVTANSGPSYHVAGTNAIGSVVDSNLKVLGTKNLFVLDASVMPFVPNCNTGFPTAILAETGVPHIISSCP